MTTPAPTEKEWREIIEAVVAEARDQVAAVERRAEKAEAALRRTPQYSSEADCTWCGAEERVVYADRVYQEGEPHKPTCPRVLLPEVWEEKA